jgi:hypothetical protein
MKTAVVAFALAGGMFACARRLPPPVHATDVAWAQTRWPNVTQQDLEQGRKILQSKCGGSCHRAPQPHEQPAASWPGHVAEMAERAGLTPESQRLLEQYLITLASTNPSAR